MKIDFYVGHTWEEVRPAMLTEGGCGGSEVALIKMAEELTKLGHEVKVWGPHTGEYTYDSHTCSYLDFHLYNGQLNQADVTVMWRNVAPIQTQGLKGLVVLWLHDLGLPTLPDEMAARVDYLFCLSQFHADSITKNNPKLKDKVVLTANGIDMTLYPDDEPAKDPNAFIYSSSPRRGLGKLLREWPTVRKTYPEAVLHVAYGFELSISMCEKVGNTREAAIYKSMLASIKRGIPGVVYHGRLNQPELAKLQRSCFAWLYPDNDFEETFCITALEAHAAKLRVISRENGALPETLHSYMAWPLGMSVTEAVTLVSEQYGDTAVSESYHATSDFTWTNIAKSWETTFHGV